MKAGYTAKDLAEILGISKQAILRRATKGKWSATERPNPKGGGFVKAYESAKLPKDVRDKIAEFELQRVLGAPGESCPLPLYKEEVQASPMAPAVSDRRVAPALRHGPQVRPSERADRIGLAKYQIVHKWRETTRAAGWGKRREATAAFLTALPQLLPGAYETLKVLGGLDELSEKTLYSLDKRLREAGDDYFALADGRGGWRKHGTTRWRNRTLCLEAQEALLQSWLSPNRPSVQLAIRASRMVLDKHGIDEPAHDATWRRWLEDWARTNQDIVVMQREGEKAYWDKVGPYITRDTDYLTVGQALVADGHDLNFEILHPGTGRPCRMALIVFFDWASRMPVGWQIMPTENTSAVQGALYNAILTLGKLPQVVYLDNGKAFKNRFFKGSNPDFTEFRGLYSRLGINMIFARPYNARAKIVERFFLTLGHQFERILPSYCGAGIEDKPAWRMRNEKLQQAWHMARTQGWVPTIREAAHFLGLYFQWYGEQPHDGIGGSKPLELLAAGRGPGVDLEALRYQFLWAEKRTPRRCRVTLYGVEYESDCLHGLSGDVVIRYSTSDLSRVHLYRPESAGGGYLGDALPVEALHPLAELFGDEVSVDQVKAELKRQRKLVKQTRENLAALGLDGDGLKALPWNQKVAVIQGGKDPSADRGPSAPPVDVEVVDHDAEENRRLQLVYERLAEEKPEPVNPCPERPEMFFSPIERYEWCFRARYEYRSELGVEDVKFMEWYETEPEFLKLYAARYADLRELFALQG